MAAIRQLNLIGTVSPFCLLEFKAVLARVRPKQVLEVLIQDPDVAADLIRLVERSRDRLLEKRQIGDHFRIRIQRAGVRQTDGKEET